MKLLGWTLKPRQCFEEYCYSSHMKRNAALEVIIVMFPPENSSIELPHTVWLAEGCICHAAAMKMVWSSFLKSRSLAIRGVRHFVTH